MSTRKLYSVSYTYAQADDASVFAESEADARAQVEARWGFLDEFAIQDVEQEPDDE